MAYWRPALLRSRPTIWAIPAPLVRREIQSGLAEAGQSLVAGLADVDRLSRRIDKALDEAERWRGYDAERKKRGAGRECAAGLKGPEDKLRAAEALSGFQVERLLRLLPS